MAFDYQQFLKGYHDLCKQTGSHPEDGISAYAAANYVASKRKQAAWATYNKWWHNPLLWREWKTTERHERPVEDEAFTMLKRGTRLHIREAAIPSEHRNIKLSLRDIHRQRGVKVTQINVALPEDTPELIPILESIPGYPRLKVSEIDYVPLSNPVASQRMRQRRAWKIDKVAAEYFPQGS